MDADQAKAKYDYWHKLPVTKHKFFKIMLGNFEHELRIPRKFVQNFREELPSMCTLRGPSGKEWSVQVSEGVDDVLFTRGWDTFVRDNGVKAADFLVFHYAGESVFKVSVYSPTGCEREESYFPDVNMSDDDDGEDDDNDDGDREGQGSGCSSYHPRLVKSRKHQAQKKYISCRRKVTGKEKKKACVRAEVQIERSKSSGVPAIGIVMLPTHVYKGLYLTIPKEWAMRHMLHSDHDVELQVAGSENYWLVGCRWIQSAAQCQLRPKWADFVLDNNLEEGDVVVFELVRKGNNAEGRPILNVHIFRVVDQVVPLINVRN